MDELMKEDAQNACRNVHEFLDAEAKLLTSDAFDAELMGFSILISILHAKIDIVKDACKKTSGNNLLKEILSELYMVIDSLIEKEYLDNNSNSCAEHQSPIHSG